MGKNFIKLITSGFRAKHRISVRRPHDGKEVWYLFLSPMNILVALLSFMLITTAIVIILVTYTPVLDMIPGYPGGRSRDILLENVLRLDSLQQKIEQWNRYRDNIALIIDGKTPMPVTTDSTIDSLSVADKEIVPASKEDSIFRESAKQIKAENKATTKEKPRYELYTPVQGVVVKPFDLSLSNMGVKVSVKGGSEIIGATDGVVVLESWSPLDGNIIAIQHGANLISIYKNLARILKKRGERVSGGEVIGYAADTEEGKEASMQEITIELWDGGVATDPERYMLF